MARDATFQTSAGDWIDLSEEISSKETPLIDKGDNRKELPGHCIGGHEEHSEQHVVPLDYIKNNICIDHTHALPKSVVGQSSSSSRGEKRALESERTVSDDARTVETPKVQQERPSPGSGGKETKPPRHSNLKSLDEIWREIEEKEARSNHTFGFRFSKPVVLERLLHPKLAKKQTIRPAIEAKGVIPQSVDTTRESTCAKSSTSASISPTEDSRVGQSARGAMSEHRHSRDTGFEDISEPEVEVLSRRLVKKSTIRPGIKPKIVLPETEDTTSESAQSSASASTNQAEDTTVGQSGAMGEHRPSSDTGVEDISEPEVETPSPRLVKKSTMRPAIKPKNVLPETEYTFSKSARSNASANTNQAEDTRIGQSGVMDEHRSSSVTGIGDIPFQSTSGSLRDESTVAHQAEGQESFSTEEGTASKGKAVVFEGVDPNLSLQETSSTSNLENLQECSQLFAPKVGEGISTAAEAEVSSRTKEDMYTASQLKGKAVVIEDMDPNLPQQEVSRRSHEANVQESPQVLVPLILGEGSNLKIVPGAEPLRDAEPSYNTPTENTDDEIPAWKRKMIKIVSICCFCNTTNAA